MPNGLALAIAVLILAIVISYVVSMLLSLFLSTSHTKRKDLKNLVKDMNLKKNDVFVDLGCGDGRVVFEVAKQYPNVKSIGYDISPISLMIANLSKLLLYPFTKKVEIIAEDFTKTNLQDATVVFINWGTYRTKRLETFLKEIKKTNIRIIEAK